MNYYGAKELAAAFRTVRKNTIQIAEEIPEEHYGFHAAPGTRTVAADAGSRRDLAPRSRTRFTPSSTSRTCPSSISWTSSAP